LAPQRCFGLNGQTKQSRNLNLILECLAIVTGVFGEIHPGGIPAEAQSADPDGMFIRINDGKVDDSVLRALGLADLPNSYIKFRFDRHPNAEAFRLAPEINYFRVTNAALDPRDPKNIEVTVTIAKPSPTGALDVKKATEDNGLVAQLPVAVKQLVPGQVRKNFRVQYDTIWIAAPKKPSDDEVGGVKEKLSPGESLNVSPANLFVTYREVEEPDLMLEILASIVSDNSSEVDAGVEKALRSTLSKGGKQE
jgi:hypothetical protein